MATPRSWSNRSLLSATASGTRVGISDLLDSGPDLRLCEDLGECGRDHRYGWPAGCAARYHLREKEAGLCAYRIEMKAKSIAHQAIIVNPSCSRGCLMTTVDVRDLI